jgi:hypothetical protein
VDLGAWSSAGRTAGGLGENLGVQSNLLAVLDDAQDAEGRLSVMSLYDVYLQEDVVVFLIGGYTILPPRMLHHFPITSGRAYTRRLRVVQSRAAADT